MLIDIFWKLDLLKQKSIQEANTVFSKKLTLFQKKIWTISKKILYLFKKILYAFKKNLNKFQYFFSFKIRCKYKLSEIKTKIKIN